MKRNLLLLTTLGLFLSSCSTYKYIEQEKLYREQAKYFSKILNDIPEKRIIEYKEFEVEGTWIASPNFGLRRPNYVIIHHTAQDSLQQTIKTFHNQQAAVSSHYVIGRKGEIVQMVNNYFRAHHAGAGKWGNDTDLNSSSIGIELDNNGVTDPWTPEQMDALLKLLNYLKTTYRVPQANFLGHMDIAPTRKIDPSNFPWKTLSDAGFGYWYDENQIHEIPEKFEELTALRIIGYDISNPEAAIKAFKRHYIQDNEEIEFSESERQILYQIYLLYR